MKTNPEYNKGSIAWMAGHSVAANLIMLVCLVGGFISLKNIKQEIFPEFQIELVNVSVPYPGASPEEVENGVILVVEEAVRGLDGVSEITSVASEGSGMVSIELITGSDPQTVTQDIKSAVDRITTFPEDAEKPRISLATHKHGVLTLVIFGDTEKTVLHELAERARDQLLQNPGIIQVDLEGVPNLEISIEISQENLRRYGITLDEVAAKLRNASVDMPAGGIKTRTSEILVRIKERRNFGQEFAQLPIIVTADGSELRLGQIAVIEDSFADVDRYSTYNGKPAVMLEVYRVGDQTPIQVADAVRSELQNVRDILPTGIEAVINHDRSEYYRERINLLLKNGALGIVLVLVILGIFLESRLAFWVMMGLPISFLGSFLFLPFTGVTINMMSLFAFIIAIGIVVDDAIIVGENVYHFRQEGLPILEASIRGAREVAMPVTFSIMTNVAAFMPIYFIPGGMGRIFQMIPIVVCLTFIISLFESLFVLPAHLAHQNNRHRDGISGWLHAQQQVFSNSFKQWVRVYYGRFLEVTLKNRCLTILIALSVLIIMSAYALSGRMGFHLFPVIESDRSEATVVLPYGSPVDKTEVVLTRLLASANEVLEASGHPELVKEMTMDVGRGGSHSGRLRVELAPPEIRNGIMSTEEFTERWREVSGEIPGLEYLRFASDSGGPGGRGRPVTVELSHRDMSILENASLELAEVLQTYPIVKDVDDGFQPGKPQLDFTIKPEGKSLGLTAREVARQVRHAFYGSEVLRQQRGRNEIRVMVRLPEDERSSEHIINELLIRTPAGTFVLLRDVATMTRDRAYMSIERRKGRRVVQVSADVSPRSRAGEVISDLRSNTLADLKKKYPGLQYSFEGHQADMRESMSSLKISFALAMLAIYGMLAIPFRSYIQPFVVMLSIPFGVVGAFIGHLIMGYDLCIPSMFGIVALSGVVVNDSLVMIELANRRHKVDGLSHFDAIKSAAIQRFRPIVLTTLTTFGGLSPMIFESSRQARFLIPMALSLGFGILFATFITLLIVPSLYMVVPDFERIMQLIWHRLLKGNPNSNQ